MNYCPQYRTRGYTAPKSLSLAGAHALLWQEMGDVLAGELFQISEKSATPKSSKSDHFSTDTYGFGDPPVLRPLPHMLVAKFHIFMQQILNFDGFTFPHSQWVRTDLRVFLTDALQDGRVSVNSSAMAAIIIFPIRWPIWKICRRQHFQGHTLEVKS